MPKKKKEYPKKLIAIYGNSQQNFVAKTKAHHNKILRDAELIRKMGYKVQIKEAVQDEPK